LKGRYIDCCQDLGEMLARIDEIKAKNMYKLTATVYPTDIVNPRDQTIKESQT